MERFINQETSNRSGEDRVKTEELVIPVRADGPSPSAINIAKLIGGVDPNKVQTVIDARRNGRYLLHGVTSNYAEVEKEGVKALTPEGGNVSYWNSGSLCFGSGTDSSMAGINSAFFNYAHSGTPTGSAGTLVVARHPYLVKKLGIQDQFVHDAELTLGVDVPIGLVHILRAELIHAEAVRSRATGQRVEQILLDMLCQTLVRGYRPGELTVRRDHSLPGQC